MTANFSNPVYAQYTPAQTDDRDPCAVPMVDQKFISGAVIMDNSDFTDVRLSNGSATMSTFVPT